MSNEKRQNPTHKKGLSPKQQAFIAAFRETATVAGAAKAAEVDRSSHYRWLREDAEYAADFDDAVKFAAAHLVDAAMERAIEGTRRLKFNKAGFPLMDPDTGKPYVEHTYSDVLLIFLLKNLQPERFGDKQHVTHAVDDWRSKLEEQGVDPDQFLGNLREAMERTEQQN